MSITFEEWTKQLRDLRTNVDGGFTIKELSAAANMSLSWAHHAVVKLVERGECEYIGKKPMIGITGRQCWVPVYKLKNNTNETQKNKKTRKGRI